MSYQKIQNRINKDGFVHLKNIISQKLIKDIKSDMILCMEQFVSKIKNKNLDVKIDHYFNEITKKRGNLRSHVYKSISNMLKLYELSTSPKVQKILKNLEINSPRHLGTSIFAIEPQQNKFLTEIHQDIRNNFVSLKSLNLWFPLNSGKQIGGLGIYSGSHLLGPIKHRISKKSGFITVDSKFLKKFKFVKITNFKAGDLILFSPFSLHCSIKNKGKKIRWTAAMCIDDISKTPHLNKKFNPFEKDKYVTNLTNEELLKFRN